MISFSEFATPRGSGSLVLTAILLMANCGVPSQPEAEKEETGPERLLSQPAIDHVVWITIDTLRADHLPEFGYPVDTAPFLTRLGAKSVRFQKAFAHSATTGPSHSSMFTSLYPLQHRVQNNAQVLDDGFVTVAEVLSAQSYETSAFVSVDGIFGASQIAQGFQHFDAPGTRMPDSQIRYRDAQATTDRVLAWLEDQSPDAKSLLWVHYYDPHGPLRPPPKHLNAVAPPDTAKFLQLRDFLRDAHRSQLREEVVGLIIRYDAEIRFVDSQIERLYQAVQTWQGESTTLWVITSDHGQGLANHGHFGHHENIYNEQLRVPLIFYFSDTRVAPRRISGRLVEHVDLPVTILELLGQSLTGQPEPVQGRSLVPLLQGRSRDRERRFAFSERRRRSQSGAASRHEAGELYSLQSLTSKYQWFSEGPDEFYDLRRDPYETENRIDGDLPEKEELREALLERVQQLRSDGEADGVDEETLEKLRALGYVD